MDLFRCTSCGYEWGQEPRPEYSHYDGRYMGKSRMGDPCHRCGSLYAVDPEMAHDATKGVG